LQPKFGQVKSSESNRPRPGITLKGFAKFEIELEDDDAIIK